MPSSRLKNWKTMPMCWRRMMASSFSSMPTSDSPATTTSPSSGTSRPAMMLSSVDLPQPDGPITATNSPWRTVEVGAAQRPHRRGVLLEGAVHAAHLDGGGDAGRRRWSRAGLDACSSVRFLRSSWSDPVGDDRRRRGPSPVAARASRRPPGGAVSAAHVASLSTVWPGSANCCRRWHRFTASPTTVYSSRSSLPSRAAATARWRGRSRARTAPAPRPRHSAFTLGLGGVHGAAPPRGRGRRGRRSARAHRTRPSRRRRRTASPCHRRQGWHGSSRPGAG